MGSSRSDGVGEELLAVVGGGVAADGSESSSELNVVSGGNTGASWAGCDTNSALKASAVLALGLVGVGSEGRAERARVPTMVVCFDCLISAWEDEVKSV